MSAPASKSDPIYDVFRIEATLQRAVRQALLRHKRLGEQVVVWRDGQVRVLDPDEIPDDGEDSQQGPVI